MGLLVPAELMHLASVQRIRSRHAILGPADVQGGRFEIDYSIQPLLDRACTPAAPSAGPLPFQRLDPILRRQDAL
jgi:hypothetical protein